jgi:flagellar motor switch protein FliN
MTTSTISDLGTIPVDAARLPAWLMKLWSDSLETVIESMLSDRPTVTFQPSQEKSHDAKRRVWWGQPLSLVPAPALWIGAPVESWQELGRLVLSALGVAEPTDDDVQATCRDLLAQVGSALAQFLTQQFGEEVRSGDVVASDQPDCSSPAIFDVELKVGRVSLEGTAQLDRTFLDCLHEFAQRTRDETQQELPEDDESEAAPPDTRQSKTLLPKVELRVRVVLGRTSLPLRDVFKMNVGSVIELDRGCADLADVMIDDHTIARGEIVGVNGNYGIKGVAKK